MKTIKYLLVLLILALATPTTQAKTYKEYTLDELIQAADNGDGFAQFMLGIIYSYHKDEQQKYGVQTDYAKAKKYFYMCVKNSDARLEDKVIAQAYYLIFIIMRKTTTRKHYGGHIMHCKIWKISVSQDMTNLLICYVSVLFSSLLLKDMQDIVSALSVNVCSYGIKAQ